MSIRSILLAYDGTVPAQGALTEAVELARALQASLRIVTVIPIVAGAYGVELPPGPEIDSTIHKAKKTQAELKARLEKEGGLPKVETILLEGDPVDRVLDEAEQHPPDLLVVGSRGLSGAGRFFLGSVSDGILHHARCSVLVVRPTPGARKHEN
jgi:nucleotide-binding universal stress UspA family protein